MPATLAQRRRKHLAKWGIGMPGNNDHILNVARQLQAHVTVPVLGGIAVYLHGYLRSTADLDFYTADRHQTNDELLAAGAKWDVAHREHVLDGVRIHTVTPADARHVVQRVSEIQGIRVVSLKDLIAIKLLTGTREIGRAKDLGDVQELIRAVPLDKTFAPKLPKPLRDPFKAMVDAVRQSDKAQRKGPRF